jgi:hypothetical protein
MARPGPALCRLRALKIQSKIRKCKSLLSIESSMTICETLPGFLQRLRRCRAAVQLEANAKGVSELIALTKARMIKKRSQPEQHAHAYHYRPSA